MQTEFGTVEKNKQNRLTSFLNNWTKNGKDEWKQILNDQENQRNQEKNNF